MASDDFCGRLSRLLRGLKVMDKEGTSCCGRTMQQNALIEALDRCGPLTMNALSNEVGVAVSTMTRAVDLLVRDGLVSRVCPPNDRRQVEIVLSATGKKAASDLSGRCREYSDMIMKQIPKEAHERVLDALELLATAVEKCKGRCCP